jgi:4-carboxymuconolactone decarboxylase
MDIDELHQRGLRLRESIFGKEAVEKRMTAFGEFGAPLQHIINAYIYGDVWSRDGLPMSVRSLVMIGITAATNRPQELGVHLRGALANGCTPAEIQDVLLLVAMYCGVPASIEAHRVAVEVLGAAAQPAPAAEGPAR